jgi:hypothetical protein
MDKIWATKVFKVRADLLRKLWSEYKFDLSTYKFCNERALKISLKKYEANRTKKGKNFVWDL